MKISSKKMPDDKIVLTIDASPSELTAVKVQVLERLSTQVKVPGFRSGKVPSNLVEKHIDQTLLQSEFLEEAVSGLYQAGISQQKLRPIEKPEIQLVKFVPFTTLQFSATITVLGEIVLPDYKKIKVERSNVVVSAKDVAGVVDSLQKRMAEKVAVVRPAKAGDEVVIDFDGTDKAGKSINGASGKDYPLTLGSDAFIPGFEANLIGVKPGEAKTFTLQFPKDYGVAALANQHVTFKVGVKLVNELQLPKVDDDFAAKCGPFKTLGELKTDIKKQLTLERQQEQERQYESKLVEAIADKTKVSIPKLLIDDSVEAMLRDLRQNLVYKGQTYEEFLTSEKTTDQKYRQNVLAPQAEKRVKASLVLAEIAEQEKLDVGLEELEVRMQLLKSQYQDAAMQAELEKPETRRDIASRILTEKVLRLLKK